MRTRLLLLTAVGFVVIGPTPVHPQEPKTGNVSKLIADHDRALIRDLKQYLLENPGAPDRDQAYAALFNKAIEHDWFSENEQIARSYLSDTPEGPVRALAQIIRIMAQAEAGHTDLAFANFEELMRDLEGSDQEEFALSFTESFASRVMTAGEFGMAKKIYRVLQQRFPESLTIRERCSQELVRLELVGQPAPKLETLDLRGEPFRLGDLKGRYVLLDFWATWCAPWVAELPQLQELYQKYRDKGFEIVGVNIDDTREAAVDFTKTRKLPWIQVSHGSTPEILDAYGVVAIPATYLITPDGRILAIDLRGESLRLALDARMAGLEDHPQVPPQREP